jgi:hypothetical protein
MMTVLFHNDDACRFDMHYADVPRLNSFLKALFVIELPFK